MAKSEVFERDPVVNLKKELQILVESIVDEEIGARLGFGFTECVDKATKILQDLKELKEGKKQRSYDDDDNNSIMSFDCCPDEFNCPISNEIMRDPVIVSTGKVISVCFYILFVGDVSVPVSVSCGFRSPNYFCL